MARADRPTMPPTATLPPIAAAGASAARGCHLLRIDGYSGTLNVQASQLPAHPISSRPFRVGGLPRLAHLLRVERPGLPATPTSSPSTSRSTTAMSPPPPARPPSRWWCRPHLLPQPPPVAEARSHPTPSPPPTTSR